MKKKILYALLSFIVAFGIWLYVITVVSPESEATFYNVPVVLNNESILKEKGMMLIIDKDPTVTLRLKGNRSELNQLKSSDITVLCDLSKVNTAGQQVLNYVVSFPGGNSFTILEQSPSTLSVTIAEWSTKEVDVVVAYSGSVPADYIVDEENAELDHRKVIVTGPASVVSQITQARIDVDLAGRTETIIEGYRYTLCDAAGQPVDAAQVTTNLAEINMTVRIQKTKELPVVLNVIYGGGATESNTQVVIDPLSIKVAGSEKLLEDLINIDLGTIDLSQVEDDTVQTFDITLPEGVTNLTGKSQVTVTIDFRNLNTVKLTVTKERFSYVGTPPGGMEITFAPEEYEIRLRGSAKDINQIDPKDIIVTIDLTGAAAGDNQCKAEVTVTGEYAQSVGALGSYTVTITLAQKQTQEAS